MKDYLPGTTLETNWSSPDPLGVLDAVFSAGGLVLSQVARLTGLEPHTIQNWVKRGFCAPPVAKQYSKRQFCRLVIINMLKDSLSLPQITAMLSYINNSLQDETDDTIGDDALYRYFVTILLQLDRTVLLQHQEEILIAEAARFYKEPYPGARKRLERVLQVMITAYFASHFKVTAEALLKHLD